MEKQSDEYYVSLASKGDEKAFGHILKSYKGMVISQAKHFYMDGYDFEDVLQEGNLGLVKAINGYSPEKGSSFASFAEICIRTQIMDAVKKTTKKSIPPSNVIVSMDSDDESGEAARASVESKMDHTTADPEEIFIKSEESRIIRDILKKNLTPMERKVLAMMLEEKSYSQMAEELGRDKKSIDNTRSRIKKKLAALLKSGGMI